MTEPFLRIALALFTMIALAPENFLQPNVPYFSDPSSKSGWFFASLP